LSEPLMEMINMIDMIEIKGRGFRNRATTVGTAVERGGNNYCIRLKPTGMIIV